MNAPLEAALAVLWPVLNEPDAGHVLVAAKCYGLIQGYAARWENSPYRIVSVEDVLTSDLVNPDTTRRSRTFTVAGKLDVRAVEIATGKKVLFDHKTTSDSISDPSGPYWQQLVVEGQPTHYMLLEWLNGNQVDLGVWDVVKKPGISPKLVAKKDALAVSLTRRYFDWELDAETFDRFEAMEEKRETPMMYAARLAFDCTHERPQEYFQRKSVPRMAAEIHEYASELWDIAQDVLVARNTARNPRNSGACMTYNTPCEYLGVCSGHDTLESDRWLVKPWVHPELPVLSGRGVEILTNSRIRCFQTCRRKHYFRYELGVGKVNEDEKEALYFGTLFHVALEQYFLTLMREQERLGV